MRNTIHAIALPAGAMLVALLLFGVLVWFAGVNPVDVWVILFKGAFGDWFSWQNTLQRAAPLMLTALCVAIPARAGLAQALGVTSNVLADASFVWDEFDAAAPGVADGAPDPRRR